MSFDAIFCIDSKRGIGKNNRLPWKIKSDMSFFRRMTLDQVVIMGSRTWDSLSRKSLPQRKNFLVSSRDANISMEECDTEKPVVCASFDLAYSKALEMYPKKEIFMIGGASLMKTASQHKAFRYLYLTHLDKDFHCDAFLDPFEEVMELEEVIEEGIDEASGVKYLIKRYRKI